MTQNHADLVAEIMDAFQILDKAAQDMVTALPGQMSERSFRLEGARVGFMATLKRMAYEASGPLVDAEALGGAFGDVRRPDAPHA